MSQGPFVQVPNNQEHTEVISYASFVGGLFKYDPNPKNMKMHAAIGVSGEAGELIDAIKKHWVYGKPIDEANVLEELGDLMFYIQAMANLFNFSLQQILQGNADKLAKRYVGLKYTDEAAIARADKNGEN